MHCSNTCTVSVVHAAIITINLNAYLSTAAPLQTKFNLCVHSPPCDAMTIFVGMRQSEVSSELVLVVEDTKKRDEERPRGLLVFGPVLAGTHSNSKRAAHCSLASKPVDCACPRGGQMPFLDARCYTGSTLSSPWPCLLKNGHSCQVLRFLTMNGILFQYRKPFSVPETHK